MKILQVIPYFCFGGAETMCENLCYALKKMGHEVIAVSLYNRHTPISDRMERAGIPIVFLDKKMGLDLSMIPKLCQIMKREKPDAVHTHLDVIKYTVLAAKLSGIKRCVHTIHSVAYKEAEGKLQKISNYLYYHLGWSVPVALSPEVRQTVCDFYHRKPQDVPVIYNGIDLSRYSPKESYLAAEEMTIVHVGRFDTPKNHEGLLHAFAEILKKHPNSRLHLVGDGDLRSRIEELAEALNLGAAVVFHGTQSDVHPYLYAGDIFVLPSKYEGMPMTIIEAMATGLPIVASNVGGIPDMVKDGRSALLVPCEPLAVAAACERLMESQALREALGENAIAESRRFSAEHMAERYAAIYSEK